MRGTRDQRYTCLAGRRVKKSAEVLELLGGLDELNCLLGLAKAFSSEKKIIGRLDKLQEDLFQVSGWLAGARVRFDFGEKTRELEEETEKRRDPDLKEFVKPGKDKISAFLHLARAVARRAERKAVGLQVLHLRGDSVGSSEVRKWEGEQHLGGDCERTRPERTCPERSRRSRRGESDTCEVVSLVAYLNRLSGLLFWLAERVERAKEKN